VSATPDAARARGPETGRFAPSTTGPAHPGTLLAALLCWLDARSRGVRLVLRLEDLDPQRSRPRWSVALRADLAWLGLDWDAVFEQHAARAWHEAALDQLERDDRLYPCRCSRRDLRRANADEAGRGRHYPGTCRGRALPAGGWRSAREPLRVALPGGWLALRDESGLDLSQDPLEAFGDPIVRRRDGAIAYQLAGVVDDARVGVTRVVRGRDLADSTALQVALQQLLGLPAPSWRHHLLLLEERGVKLAKLHGAVGAEALRRAYDAAALCGLLAHAAGLLEKPEPVTPEALLADFRWERVAEQDRALRWTGERLELLGSNA
jgi:glutamyl-tRNA synthetase/glutamyl-Q tRNA(Asp) synthetase